MIDVAFKLFRKFLPSKWYRAASHSVFGIGRNYYVPETYRAIGLYYERKCPDVAGLRVLEVGPGSQLFTAFLFFSRGALEVLVADPRVDPGSARAQLDQYNAFTGAGMPDSVLERLHFFKDASVIPAAHDARIDLVCSYNVLEHLPDLQAFFAANARLLSPGGVSCHRVDVSDHTYHVFDNRLLAKFPPFRGLSHRGALTHLRYSDRAFGLLNDPKCFMNRKLLPVFLEVARRNGLEAHALERSSCPPAPIHADLRATGPDWTPENLYLTDFFFTLSRPGPRVPA